MVHGKPGCPGESREAEDVVVQPLRIDQAVPDQPPDGRPGGRADLGRRGQPAHAAAVHHRAAGHPGRSAQPRLRVLLGLAVLGYILKDTFVPLPAAPFSWDALAAGITLAAGIVLPLAYPPVRRGIANSPLLKAGASALLGTRPGQ
jgi:hypothetical protein